MEFKVGNGENTLVELGKTTVGCEEITVEFKVGKGGTIREEDAVGPGNVDNPVEFQDGIDHDGRRVPEEGRGGGPGGTAVTVMFNDTKALLGFGTGIVGNVLGNGTGVSEPVTFQGPVGVGTEIVTKLNEGLEIDVDKFEDSVMVGIGGKLVGGAETTAVDDREALSDGIGGRLVGKSEGNERPPLIVENPIEREMFTVGAEIVGMKIDDATPVVNGIDGGTDSEGRDGPLEDIKVDNPIDDAVAFSVGNGGGDNDGRRAEVDGSGSAKDVETLALTGGIDTAMLLLVGRTDGVFVMVMPVPIIERVDVCGRAVVLGAPIDNVGRIENPIEFEGLGISVGIRMLENIPVPGGGKGSAIEDGGLTGGLRDTLTDCEGRGMPDGSTQVTFCALTAPTSPSASKEEPSIFAADFYSYSKTFLYLSTDCGRTASKCRGQ